MRGRYSILRPCWSFLYGIERVQSKPYMRKIYSHFNILHCNCFSHTVKIQELPKSASSSARILLDELNKSACDSIFPHETVYKMLDVIQSNISKFNDDNIKELLDILVKIKTNDFYLFAYDKHVIRFMSIISAECLHCLNKWDTETRYAMLDIFVNLEVRTPTIKFASAVLRQSFSEIHNLSKEQVIRLMFFINKYRLQKLHVSLHDIECYLDKHLDKLDIDTVGLFLSIFTKREKHILDSFLCERIFKIFCKNYCSMSSKVQKLYLKPLNHNGHYGGSSLIKRLNEFTNTHSRSLDFDILLHTLSENRKLLNYDKTLLENVALRYAHGIRDLSFTAIENAVRCFSHFNFNLSNVCIYQVTLDDIWGNRLHSVLQNPNKLVRVAYYCSLVNVYHHNLINKILSTDFLHMAYGYQNADEKCLNINVIPKHILTIHYGILIDSSHYDGKLLGNDLKTSLITYYINSFDNAKSSLRRSQTQYLEYLQDIQKQLDEIFGLKGYVQICYILPHFLRQHLIFSVSYDNVPQNLTIVSQFDVVRPQDVNKWYCVMLLNDNGYKENVDTKFLGDTIAEYRQLKKLGYHIIKIRTNWWRFKLPDNKKQFLREIIFK